MDDRTKAEAQWVAAKERRALAIRELETAVRRAHERPWDPKAQDQVDSLRQAERDAAADITAAEASVRKARRTAAGEAGEAAQRAEAALDSVRRECDDARAALDTAEGRLQAAVRSYSAAIGAASRTLQGVARAIQTSHVALANADHEVSSRADATPVQRALAAVKVAFVEAQLALPPAEAAIVAEAHALADAARVRSEAEKAMYAALSRRNQAEQTFTLAADSATLLHDVARSEAPLVAPRLSTKTPAYVWRTR